MRAGEDRDACWNPFRYVTLPLSYLTLMVESLFAWDGKSSASSLRRLRGSLWPRIDVVACSPRSRIFHTFILEPSSLPAVSSARDVWLASQVGEFDSLLDLE